MPVIEISSLTHPGVEIFSTLTEAQLRNRLEPDKGLFIAESPKVIKVALDVGYEPLALLCEHKHIYGDAAEIIERCGDIPVYTSGRELLAELTGYVLTRGVLCAMRRPVPKSMEDVCRGARRIVVIDGVVDTTNIGAIFRSAAALGMDAVLLTRNSCDPLNRRAVRVSMGTVFLVPWTWMDGPLDTLGAVSYTHLDVYKRQIYTSAVRYFPDKGKCVWGGCRFCIDCGSCFGSFHLFASGIISCLLQGAEPGSYTHLIWRRMSSIRRDMLTAWNSR